MMTTNNYVWEKILSLNDLVFKQKEEIERLNTNWKVAVEDLSKIAELLDLEEGCTIYDIEDKIERLNNIIKEVREYIDYYGITPEQNDDVMVRHILKGILKILDKENNNE